MSKPRLNCAVYTRKSSDEGLEQSFNSLDAQREACEAYIQSQKHEGWHLLSTAYDDGGYSGGSMERPALQKLMGDIQAGRINVIIVYKVDRLTRSLADFAKMVELFDKHGVSFVSVTQQFNTTTSMGRLTLNVLLSFAQFEREVTGERIRDKIAASKAKGMWMGGTVPLGYAAVERSLIPIPEEVEKVRYIYERYLALGSVRELQAELKRDDILSKTNITKSGKKIGGKHFARGALYELLQNELYIGQIRHKDKIYAGLHEAIIPQELWASVQRMLSNNRVEHKTAIVTGQSLLTGMLYDDKGERLTPSNTVRSGKRYRYYVLASTTQIKTDAKLRLPAGELENLIIENISEYLEDQDKAKTHDQLIALKATDVILQKTALLQIVDRIVVYPSQIIINLKAGPTLTLDYRFSMHGIHKKLVSAENPQASESQKQTMLKSFIQGYAMRKKLLEQPGTTIAELMGGDSKTKTHLVRLIHLSFIAPDFTLLILKGNIPDSLMIERLKRDLPISWKEQIRFIVNNPGRYYNMKD